MLERGAACQRRHRKMALLRPLRLLLASVCIPSVLLLRLAGPATAATVGGGAEPSPVKPGPKAGVLNVHMIPHSHDDPGWVKTVDEYCECMCRHSTLYRPACMTQSAGRPW